MQYHTDTGRTLSQLGNGYVQRDNWRQQRPATQAHSKSRSWGTTRQNAAAINKELQHLRASASEATNQSTRELRQLQTEISRLKHQIQANVNEPLENTKRWTPRQTERRSTYDAYKTQSDIIGVVKDVGDEMLRLQDDLMDEARWQQIQEDTRHVAPVASTPFAASIDKKSLDMTREDRALATSGITKLDQQVAQTSGTHSSPRTNQFLLSTVLRVRRSATAILRVLFICVLFCGSLNQRAGLGYHIFYV